MRSSAFRILVGVLLVGGLSACMKKHPVAPAVPGDQSTQNTTGTDPTSPAGAGNSGPAVSVRTVTSAYSNMLRTVGVTPVTGGQTVDPIVTAFQASSGRLSIQGGASYSGPMGLAFLQLAQPICAKGVSSGSLASVLPSGTNPQTTANTITALKSASTQQALITGLAGRLWGTTTVTAGEMAALQAELNSFIANPGTGAGGTTLSGNAQLSAAVTGLCATMAAAPEATSKVPHTN